MILARAGDRMVADGLEDEAAEVFATAGRLVDRAEAETLDRWEREGR